MIEGSYNEMGSNDDNTDNRRDKWPHPRCKREPVGRSYTTTDPLTPPRPCYKCESVGAVGLILTHRPHPRYKCESVGLFLTYGMMCKNNTT
jgi:hypothetical protein